MCWRAFGKWRRLGSAPGHVLSHSWSWMQMESILESVARLQSLSGRCSVVSYPTIKNLIQRVLVLSKIQGPTRASPQGHTRSKRSSRGSFRLAEKWRHCCGPKAILKHTVPAGLTLSTYLSSGPSFALLLTLWNHLSARLLSWLLSLYLCENKILR